MKVRIRDDESNEDVGTWTLCFPTRPCSRRERDDERKDEAPDQNEQGGASAMSEIEIRTTTARSSKGEA